MHTSAEINELIIEAAKERKILLCTELNPKFDSLISDGQNHQATLQRFATDFQPDIGRIGVTVCELVQREPESCLGTPLFVEKKT